MRGEGLELVGRAREGQAGERGQARRHLLPEARGGVEPGADGGAADGQRVEEGQRGADGGQALIEHGHPAGDLLTQGQRRGVLQVRASDLDDVGEGARLVVEDVAQPLHRGDQPTDDLLHRGHVHRRGERVVGGLRAVDVIVRVHADHLVGVHVALGAAARLPHHQGEMIVELARDHLVGGLHDGRRDVLGQQAELGVHLGGGPLEQAEGADHLGREALPGDLEVLEGALGLRAPVAVRGHLDGAHAVRLSSRRHVT